MTRGYYQEPGTRYGRPAKEIGDPPPNFSFHDTRNWDLRRWLKEIADRQGRQEWAQQQSEWVRLQPKVVQKGDKREWEGTELEPIFGPDATLVNDPDEINKLLARPAPVRQVTSQEDAAHDLALGRIVITVDPHAPDLADKLKAEAKKIRRAHPLPIKNRGHQGTNAAGINESKMQQWSKHRLVELYDLMLMGYDPVKDRKKMAAWLFPEIRNPQGRGKKLDRAAKLLNEALDSVRMIDAQTR
jgi:hypothetical protein